VTPDWMDAAACKDMSWDSYDRFFPHVGGGRSGNDEAWAPAVAVCMGCPVKADCLIYAETRGLTDGVWGGLTPDERHTRRRQHGECQECGGPTPRPLFCSQACRQRAYRRRTYAA
jgi:WhiB family redox-sensing transcriptional regulator